MYICIFSQMHSSACNIGDCKNVKKTDVYKINIPFLQLPTFILYYFAA